MLCTLQYTFQGTRVSALKRIALGISAVTLLGIAVQAGWKWWSLGRFQQRTDNAYVEADISIIAPRVAGYVRAVPVMDNQSVRAGDVLVRIEDRELQAHLAEARARLAARLAALDTLDRESALQRSAISRATAELESAVASNERAELDVVRYLELSRRQLVSRQRVEDSEVETRKARAALAAARAALAVEQRRTDLIAARREEAQAAITEARAVVARVEFDAQGAVIHAPIDGIVGNRTVRVGQYVRPGTALMAVAPLQSVYVIANFKETQLERMRPGQHAALQIDAYPGTSLRGVIHSFAPAAGSRFTILPPENATGNFTKIVQRIPVRIDLRSDHPLAGRIRPGMSVVATVDAR
jgi:membrane fusion protein (multidrug efflux system)